MIVPLQCTKSFSEHGDNLVLNTVSSLPAVRSLVITSYTTTLVVATHLRDDILIFNHGFNSI